ncbi:MAG: glycosyltransferase [Holophagae bacterium]|jgi:glycosyltransferase involved in cell wall biosynthesis
MKVGVIAAEMEGRATGVGRYLEGLLSGLEGWNHDIEWHLFFQGDPASSPQLPDGPFHPHYSHHYGSRVWWEQVSVARALSSVAPDVVFGPAYTVPFGLDAPSVVTIHDLSFELLPSEFGTRERWRRRFLARRASRVARRVITDTEHLSSLVSERYGVGGDRLAVVPLGIDNRAFSSSPDDQDAAALNRLGIRPPYLLLPGTVLERRMPRQILEVCAFLRSSRPGLRVVIAGPNRLRQPQFLSGWIGELGLAEVVHVLGWVEEKALAPLYRGAELAFYVSRHEGFGLPPLECLACGTPVVVNAGLGLDDVWPTYPFRVAEVTAESIAEVATDILANPGATARTMAKAPEMLAGQSWQQSSRRLVAELCRVV